MDTSIKCILRNVVISLLNGIKDHGGLNEQLQQIETG